MRRRRAAWDFPYEPSTPTTSPDETEPALDVIVATATSVSPEAVMAALTPLGKDVSVEPIIDRPPLHWTRVRTGVRGSATDVEALLVRGNVDVRYVAHARRSSMFLPPRLDTRPAYRARPVEWPPRATRPLPELPSSEGQWFLGKDHGVGVNRRICGTGAGTRLAVIDDDVADFEQLDLDRVVSLLVDSPPAASGHGALMVGWAAGATLVDGTRFTGVAPDASVRVYCIVKPGEDVVSLPMAIARAAFDGADVILCATYVEGSTSPLLDDALEVATRLGRRGLGAAVVLPTGRDTSSPRDSLHASLSLALGDPASDPRAHCVAPGGRRGGWFLWRDARGKLRPFANRGPAVRWLAPGDDLAYPFSSRPRLFHAESSGASAVAAGVMLLVLSCNPGLRLHELHAILGQTASAPEEPTISSALLADPADTLPVGPDSDGHDAKCGYGLLDAEKACASALDPFSLELLAMGEDRTALLWSRDQARPYSVRLARWGVRTLLARRDLEHATRVLLRHARLVMVEPTRARHHAPGAWLRQLIVLVRELASCKQALRPSRRVSSELVDLLDTLRRLASGAASGAPLEDAAFATFARVWTSAHDPEVTASRTGALGVT